MTDLEKLFHKFKNKHYAAVQTDTHLGDMDYNDERYYSVEKKAKRFWEDARQAEKEFLEKMNESVHTQSQS